MDLATLQAQYARVDLAIQQIEQSLTQSHQTEDDEHVAPRLEGLYAERARLEKAIGKYGSGGARTRRIRIVS